MSIPQVILSPKEWEWIKAHPEVWAKIGIMHDPPQIKREGLIERETR